MANVFTLLLEVLGIRKGASTKGQLPQVQHLQVIRLTPVAIKQIKQARRAGRDAFLRVGVEIFDNGGFKYVLHYEDEVDFARDYLDQSYGIDVIVAKSEVHYLSGTTIDWLDDFNGKAGFRFDNPNATKTRPD